MVVAKEHTGMKILSQKRGTFISVGRFWHYMVCRVRWNGHRNLHHFNSTFWWICPPFICTSYHSVFDMWYMSNTDYEFHYYLQWILNILQWGKFNTNLNFLIIYDNWHGCESRYHMVMYQTVHYCIADLTVIFNIWNGNIRIISEHNALLTTQLLRYWIYHIYFFSLYFSMLQLLYHDSNQNCKFGDWTKKKQLIT